MGKGTVNLQDSFLNQVRKDNVDIEMVLLDGARLRGMVRGFDNFTIIINTQGHQHLVYKHAIAQIIGRRPAQEPSAQAQSNQEPARARQPRSENREPRESRAGRPEQPPDQEDAPSRERFNTIDVGGLKLPPGDET